MISTSRTVATGQYLCRPSWRKPRTRCSKSANVVVGLASRDGTEFVAFCADSFARPDPRYPGENLHQFIASARYYAGQRLHRYK